ncbi:hypothetical protein [Nocardia brasiliensis]|uniref:hypothetical protein n=1 Tax=Nocardia brasiliensis TaxID=37326 RepID=UPI001893E176|nr:hypothetical protein [Nocardia brasiliensis]MBF6548858.1 hypothetical protein [Nocardia brasiliensis]
MDYQFDPALTDALSVREIDDERSLAERIRDHRRGEALARIQEAEEMAARVRRTAAKLADKEALDLLRARKALAEQRQAASPHAKIARLHRRKALVLGILTAAVVFAMAFSAVTVQHNIIPDGGPANLMWWMAYGLEALISGMLIALMLSTADTVEWNVIEDPRAVYAIEGVLLTLTVGLNIYPYVRAGDVFGTVVHAIAPITVGTALATHSVVSRRYGSAIEKATSAAPPAEDLNARLLALTQLGAGLHSTAPQGAPELAPAEHYTEQRALTEHPAEHRSTPARTEQLPSAPATEHPRTALPAAPQSSTTGEYPRRATSEQSTTAPAAEHSRERRPHPTRAGTTAPGQRPAPVSGEVAEAYGAAESETSAGIDAAATALSRTAPHTGSDRAEQQSTLAEHPAPCPAAEQPDRAPERSAEQQATAAEQPAEQKQSTPIVAEHPAKRPTRQPAEQPSNRRRATEQPDSTTERSAEHPAGSGLADEVQKMTKSRLPVERITEVLAQHDSTGAGAARIARDLGMGFGTVDRILGAAAKIRAEQGRVVVPLRKG